MYCTVLHCLAQFCTVLHCLAPCLALPSMHCQVLHSCTGKHCLALTSLSCSAFRCVALFFNVSTCLGLSCTVDEPSCTFFHSLALLVTVLHWLPLSQYYSLCLALSFVVLNVLPSWLHCVELEPFLALSFTVWLWLALYWTVLHYFNLPCNRWQCLAPVGPSCTVLKLSCTAECLSLSV